MGRTSRQVGRGCRTGGTVAVKILMAASCPSDRNLGVPGVMHALAEEFGRMGHQVDLLFRDRPGRLGEILFGTRLARLALRTGVDVVDSHAVEAWPLVALRRRPGVVARSHGLELAGHRRLLRARRSGGARISPVYWTYRGSVRLWTERRSIAGADAALMLNQSDMDISLREFGADPGRLILVRNGFPRGFLDEPIRVCPEPRVLFAGSWLERKGADLLPGILRGVLAEVPEAKFTIAGCGVPEETVRAALGPEVGGRTEIVTRFERASFPAVARGCSVLLFPSRSEGAPLALLEAMALGLAPVASAIPGVVERVRDGVEGLLFPVGAAAAAAGSVVDLLRNPERLSGFRSRARDSVLDLSWERIAAEQVGILERAARRRGRP